MILFLRCAAALTIVVTLLPLFRSGFWVVRVWDFPRFQLALIAAALLLTLAFFRSRFSGHESWIWFALLSATLVWQVSHFIKLTSVWPKEVADCSSDVQGVRLVVANLNYENANKPKAIEELDSLEADVLILIEVNQEWEQVLAELRNSYGHHHEEIRGEGLGLAVWSRHPIKRAETRYLVEDRRPSIWATLDLSDPVDGDADIHLVALHPTPPGLNDSTGERQRDSRVRDAELVMVAKEVAERQGESWIVAGDFNDVAWSHTTRLFKRLSGLADPRVGRYPLNSFHAEFPLVRFPIDQIFVSNGFTLSGLSRHVIQGSDHFAVSATLHLRHPNKGTEPRPVRDDNKEAKQLIEDGKRDAKDRGIDADQQ